MCTLPTALALASTQMALAVCVGFSTMTRHKFQSSQFTARGAIAFTLGHDWRERECDTSCRGPFMITGRHFD
eukprot:2752398-Amphidinium_carterae.1